MAADSAAIKSTFFHPEHLLARHHYTDASSKHSCAACELIVTGAGYRCGECDFNIHEACLSLPLQVSFDGHPCGHVLTLTHLAVGASRRRCDDCKETSGAGHYMYLCKPCNFEVHPRCTSLVDAHRQKPPHAHAHAHAHAHGGTARTMIKVGVFGFRVVDELTGGLMSPVLDAIDAAVAGW